MAIVIRVTNKKKPIFQIVLSTKFVFCDRDVKTTKVQQDASNFEQKLTEKKNILVVGPVPGKTYSEMVVPILAPDPETNKNVSYSFKYVIFLFKQQ